MKRAAVLAALVCVVLPVGTHAGRTWRPAVEVARPSFSPSGRWIAYLRETPMRGCRRDALMLVRPDGSGTRRVACGASSWSWSPRQDRLALGRWIVTPSERWRLPYGASSWSPDGRTLAVVSGEGQDRPPSLYLLDHGGRGRPRKIASAWQFAWSPSGRYLAYTAGDGTEIHVIRRNGADDRLVARGQHPEWSGDERWISFEPLNETEIDAVHPDGTGVRAISSKFGGVVWSPRGEHAAILYPRSIGLHSRDPSVELVDLRSGVTVSLGIGWPAWAPDGRRLALMSGNLVALLDAEGGGRVDVTLPADFAGWAPDGKHFVAARVTMYLVDRSGHHRRSLGEGDYASWSPDSRKIVLIRDDGAGGCTRVVVKNLRTGAVRFVAGCRPT